LRSRPCSAPLLAVAPGMGIIAKQLFILLLRHQPERDRAPPIPAHAPLSNVLRLMAHSFVLMVTQLVVTINHIARLTWIELIIPPQILGRR
jgi:hypothetical protein